MGVSTAPRPRGAALLVLHASRGPPLAIVLYVLALTAPSGETPPGAARCAVSPRLRRAERGTR
eukprot:2936977-Prymnesium_polylepis.1